MQERAILRFATTAARDNATTGIPTPSAGQVVYNAQTDRLELYSTTRSAWINELAFQYLATTDTNTSVNFAHTGASGHGVRFTPTNVIIDFPVDITNGVLTTATGSVGIQSTASTKKAVLTTNGTTSAGELVSDTPIAMPGLRMTGTGTIDATGKNVTAGAVTASSLTTSSITLTGTLTQTVGQISGTRGAIGGVDLGWDAGRTTPVAALNAVFANSGFISESAAFYGDSSGVQLRQRTKTTGATGSAYVQVTATEVNLGGTVVGITAQPRLLNNLALQYWYNSNTQTVNVAPSFYSGGDPGAGNFPDGTIWVQ
jgi:hypothetical protein